MGKGAVSEFAQQALAGATGAAVAAAILFKGATRPPGVETATLPNDLPEIPRLLDRFERFCDHHHIDGQAVAGLDVALDEILTNLISYAFRDGARHVIDVEFAVADGWLSVEVRDAGAAFNPLKVPPPVMSEDINAREVGGLGMHFVRTVADEITYRREAGWNILHLKKALKTRDEEGVEAQ
jgi:anti-sigma regulatory factor (Ser/Thr protein kinase)